MGLSLLQKVTPVKMKVLFIAATIALASAGFAPSCEECNTAAAGLLARLTSEESIAEQTGILISQVCPQADDAAACEAGLATWWSDMAMCLYPAFIGSGDACERLGLCKKRSLLGEWTCDDCTAVMTRVADFMKEPTTIKRVSASSLVSASAELRVTPTSALAWSTALPNLACRSSPLCLWRRPPSCARTSLESANSAFSPPPIKKKKKKTPKKKKKKKKKKK